MAFRIKRVYEAPAAEDGTRVLVDRLWPRGVAKDKAKLDDWLKEVAPSPALRTWFGHLPEHFAEFSDRYIAELQGNAAVAELRKRGRGQTVTLLYGARDPEINHAVVLQKVLRGKAA
ncbi:MAG TPA: DUF488 family protein [Burkholderiales bacterium]|jgi:uncharacterized protein YeaO (DUF488 family)